MMEVKFDNCSNCYNRHITSVAINWCSNCEESLCSVCTEHHQASKLLKSHPLIPVSDYHKLPHYIKDLKNCCKNHEESFQLYCQTHEQCCCVFCVKETHDGCKDIEALRYVVKDVKTSPAFEDVENGLKKLNSVYDTIRENRAENKVRLSEQKEQIIAEVHSIHKTISDHLDDLVTSIEATISSEFEAANMKIDEILSEVEDRQKGVSQRMEEVETIKQLSTDLQTFLGLPFFQDRTKEETVYIKKLQKDHKVDELDLVFQSLIPEFVCKENDSLGCVSVSEGQSRVDFNVLKGHRAQYMLPKEVYDKTVLNIQQIQYPIRDPEIFVSGCTILPSGQLLFVNYNSGKLIMRCGSTTQSGDFTEIIRLNGMRDVAFIDTSKVAITTPSSKEIVIFDLLFSKQIKTMSVSSGCWGIECLQGQLFVRLYEGDLLTMDADTGNIVKRVSSDCKTCVTVIHDKILGCRHKEGVVYCLDTDGEEVWQFQDPMLNYPRDLTTDDQGFVYVIGKKSNNVIVISPDGKTFREILNQSHGLDTPMAIHFEKTLGVLLVCNEKKGALICNIE